MSKQTSVRLPEDLHRRIVRQAKEEKRTISNLIVVLLTQALDEREKAGQ